MSSIHVPQSILDGCAGFGDSASFGLTQWIREKPKCDYTVDKNSGSYKIGEKINFAFDCLMFYRGAVKAMPTVIEGTQTAHRLF